MNEILATLFLVSGGVIVFVCLLMLSPFIYEYIRVSLRRRKKK